MEVVELLKELIKRQSVTPNECGIYEIIKAELADFEAIEIEKNGVKNLFLYKDFTRGNSSLGMQFRTCGNFGDFADSKSSLNPQNSHKYKSHTANTRICDLDSNESSESKNDSTANANSSIFDEKSGLRSHERGNRTNSSLTKRVASLPDLSHPAGCKALAEAKKDAEFATHLCFAGHIDIVPAGFGWSVPPFDALIKDGVIYGRGAQDMKGGVAAFVSALQKVKNFNGILSVLLTSDEEGDGVFGTKIMLDALKERGLLPHFAVVAEPTCEKKLGDSIKIGRRGSVNGVLKIYGTQGHAAYPHKCVNPLDLIAPILAQISSKDLDSGSEYFAPSKIVITDIRGGIEATNVTPAELKLMFNVRNNPLTDKSAIQNYIESLLKSAGIKKYDLTLSQSSFPFICNFATDTTKNHHTNSSIVSEKSGLCSHERGNKTKASMVASLHSQILRIDEASGKLHDLSPQDEFVADSSVLLDSLSRAVKSQTNTTPRPNTEGGTSDARYFSAFGVEVVEFGLVNDRIHAADECIKIVDLETLRDIFVDFIADFDSAICSNDKNSSIVSEKSGLCSHERGNKTKASMVASLHSQILRIDEASGKLHDLSPQD